MRDNSKRAGAAAEPAAAQSPFLDFATPTEMVDLPSRGEFYPEDHPLHGESTVEIKFMTARDEDILTSPSLLKKGVAIDRLIQNVIVDSSIKVDSLLSGDKAAIMIASRINGYGEEYKTKVTCPSCEAVAQSSFDLSEISVYHGDDHGEYDIKPTGNGTFIVKTPRTSLDVEVRLMTSKDESMIIKRAQELAEKKNAVNTMYQDQLSLMVISINGNNQEDVRRAFVQNVTAYESRYLRQAYTKLVPGPDMKQDFRCPSCGHEEEVEIPMTADFFWTNQ